MRKIEICISASFGCHQCASHEFEIEVEDGASDEEIQYEVEEAVFELVNWGWEEKHDNHA